MVKPIRFRYVNEAAGAFVLGTIALVVFVVFFAGHSQRWFQPVRRVTILLPEQGSLGLRPGAEVFILGVSVGTVDDITPDADGSMRAHVSVRGDYGQFVRQDSTAVIRKTFGVAGDAYVDITRGAGGPLPLVGGVIRSSADRAPTEMFGDLVVQIGDEGVSTLKEARAAIQEFQKVAADLRDPGGHLQRALSRADRIAETVERGEGLAGRILMDPAMAEEVEAALAKVNRSLDQIELVLEDSRAAAASVSELADSGNRQVQDLPALVEQTRATLEEAQELLKDTRKTTAKLPETMAALDETLRTMPGVLLQAQETLRQTERLVEGAQRHWLIWGNARPEGVAGSRIRPEDVGDSR